MVLNQNKLFLHYVQQTQPRTCSWDVRQQAYYHTSYKLPSNISGKPLTMLKLQKLSYVDLARKELMCHFGSFGPGIIPTVITFSSLQQIDLGKFVTTA